MAEEPTSARVVERYVIAKFDGDPPTADAPKVPVEVVTVERRSDDTITTAISHPKE